MSAIGLRCLHQTEHNSEVMRQHEDAYDMSKLVRTKYMIR